MEKLIFNCEVITPMFLAGADGATPELRPASIKGALRFWWRALHGEMEWKKLAEEEGKIFGNTKHRSSILIKINKSLRERSKEYMLPHKTKESERGNRSCFPDYKTSNESFDITLTLFSNRCGINLDQVKSLFILTCVLGGFGKRSRRGLGSVSVKTLEIVKKIKHENNVEKVFKDKISITPVDSLEAILRLINNLNNKYKIERNAIIRNNASFDKKEFPYITEIKIGSSTKDIKDIGFATHEVMKSDPFGYKKNVGSGTERLASPVYISLLKNQCPVITTLNLATQVNKNNSLQTELKNKLL